MVDKAPDPHEFLRHANRLVDGTNPGDFSGADAFVVVARQKSDPRYLDLSGPYQYFEAAQSAAFSLREDLGADAAGADYFVEIRPIYTD